MGGGSKHGPNRLDRYREIHETVMGQYRDQGFVLEDDLVFEPDGANVLAIVGTIKLEGDLRLDVVKKLRITEGDDEQAMVQTFAYTYNASLGGAGNVFRYCSPHDDHNDFHHKHVFDVFDGDVRGTVERIEGDDWPTLGEVLAELHEWSCDHSEALSDRAAGR